MLIVKGFLLRRPRPHPRHLAPLRSPSLRSAAKCAPPLAQQAIQKFNRVVLRRGARLSVARSAEGYKPRGRGLGQRNRNLLLVDNKEICIYVNMYLCMTMLTINIPEEMHRMIKAQSVLENTSMKEILINSFKEKYLNEKDANLEEILLKNKKTIIALADK